MSIYTVCMIATIKNIRASHGISQRKLAELADVSFRTIQLVESEAQHNVEIDTLERVFRALGYAENEFKNYTKHFCDSHPDSLRSLSRRISYNDAEWKLELFNFVDEFRNKKDFRLIEQAPVSTCDLKYQALFASVAESLCDEIKIPVPRWTEIIMPLGKPWFLAGVENLKPMAIVESPIHFKKRNIFVLENFLTRA